MPEFLSSRFKLVRYFHHVNEEYAAPALPGDYSTVWWPAWIFDSYQHLTSVSLPYKLTDGNHFQEFLTAAETDENILQHKVAYLIGSNRIPGNRRLIFEPVTQSLNDASHELVAHCQSYPGWLQACAEGSMRSAAAPPTNMNVVAGAPPLHANQMAIGSAARNVAAPPTRRIPAQPQPSVIVPAEAAAPDALLLLPSTASPAPPPPTTPPPAPPAPEAVLSSHVLEAPEPNAMPAHVGQDPISPATAAPMPDPTLQVATQQEVPLTLQPPPLADSPRRTTGSSRDEMPALDFRNSDSSSASVGTSNGDNSNKRQSTFSIAEGRTKKNRANSEDYLEGRRPSLDPMVSPNMQIQMKDVEVPAMGDDNNGVLEPIVPPPTETYSAVARGYLRLKEDGSQECRGIWANTRDQFNSGQTSNFTFSLEAHLAAAAAADPSIPSYAKQFPLDSAMYKGSFAVKEPLHAGASKNDTTVVDHQIALKFRKNTHGSFNVYGKGMNDIGMFNLMGILTMSGPARGQVELYRVYPVRGFAAAPPSESASATPTTKPSPARNREAGSEDDDSWESLIKKYYPNVRRKH